MAYANHTKKNLPSPWAPPELLREFDDIDKATEDWSCFLFGMRKGIRELSKPSCTNSSPNTWWNTSPTPQDLNLKYKSIYSNVSAIACTH